MALQGLRRTFTNRGAAESGEARVSADSAASSATKPVATFTCPNCNRTIDRGTKRCEACGQRLILDVPAGKAARLAGAGVVAGFMVGGILVGLTLPRTSAPASTAGTDQAGNGTGNGSLNANVPVAALAALRGTEALNGRLAARADDLATALDTKSFPVGDVIPVLRRISQDTRAGAGMVKSFAGWTDASDHQAALGTFYQTLGGQIDDALAISPSDTNGVKSATQNIMKTLMSIPGLDEEAQVLATQAGTDLPPITIPSSLK
jgi:hypothetical protein